MWTLFFGSVVNGTFYTSQLIRPNSNASAYNIFLPFLSHLLLLRFLTYTASKIRLSILEYKIDIVKNGFRLKNILKLFIISMSIYLVFFDLYHHNLISYINSFIPSTSTVNMAPIKIINLEKNTITNFISQLCRLIFNPFVHTGEKPLFNTSIIMILIKYFYYIFSFLKEKTPLLK